MVKIEYATYFGHLSRQIKGRDLTGLSCISNIFFLGKIYLQIYYILIDLSQLLDFFAIGGVLNTLELGYLKVKVGIK